MEIIPTRVSEHRIINEHTVYWDMNACVKTMQIMGFYLYAIFLRLLDAHVFLYTATYIFHILLTT